MNKIIVAIASLCLSLSAVAESVIRVVPFTANTGVTSSEMKHFDIEMANDEDVWGVQFDLYLPEGMTLDTASELVPYTENDRYPYASGNVYKHVVEWNALNDVPGHYWFAITPDDESFITQTSGTILRLYYVTSADMAAGASQIVVSKAVICGKTTDVRPLDAVSEITVADADDIMTAVQSPVGSTDVRAAAVYSADGGKRSVVSKGMNVVKLSDNTVKKVVVK